jgi:hypothetical protein
MAYSAGIEEKVRDFGRQEGGVVKKIAVLACFILVLLCGLYLSALLLIDAASGKAIEFLQAEAGRHGIEIKNLEYGDSLLIFPARVLWSGVSGTARFGPQSQPLPGKEVDVNIEEVRLAPQNWRESTFLLRLKGITVNLAGATPQGAPPSQDRHYLVKGKSAEVGFAMSLLPPGQAPSQARAVADGLLEMFKSGRSLLPVSFTGMASLPLDDDVYNARITVEREGGYSVLKMDEEDVILISGRIGLERSLTESEIRLIALNPLKAQRLFRIRTYARRESQRAHRRNRDVPEDAYRHVLWSYLLTKAFGAEFAGQVTDAHETGRTGNTREERLMDLHNNEIGSRYAAAGREEKELLSLVTNDPDIVSRPEDVRR